LKDIKQKIKELAKKYSNNLKNKIDNRIEEMKADDKSHYLIYQVLGISDKEGHYRTQAIKIQNTLETLYKGIGGEYYYGDSAWEYVKTRTTIDLKQILEDIAKENLGA